MLIINILIQLAGNSRVSSYVKIKKNGEWKEFTWKNNDVSTEGG